MTRDGIKRCLKLLQVNYHNYYDKFDAEDFGLMIKIWDLQFKNADDVEVFNAINKAFSSCKYPPSIAEIKELMIEDDDWNEEDAWLVVLDAGRNGIYGAYEEYEDLPEDLKAITTPETLREIAMADDESLHFIKKDIISSYKSYKNKKRAKQLSTNFMDESLLPEESRKYIEHKESN